MPGKHVHFALEAQYYASPPSEHSFPTSSIPSDASSPFSQYSPSLPASVVLHPTLVGSSSGSAGDHFEYDLTLPPTPGATIIHPRYHMSSFWDQPITNPPTHLMEIECALLPWKITIAPSRNSPLPYITFRDLFGCLYHSLRKQVKPIEYDQTKSNRQHRAHIDNAYKRRCKRIAMSADYEQQQQEVQAGVRRVDFLGEYVRFAGLVPHPSSPLRWILQMTP